MTTVVSLFGAGVLLLAVEVLMPGGLLAMLAGACLLGGIGAAFVQLGALGGSVATGFALILGAIMLYFEFVVLPKTKLARTFSMTETNPGQSQPELADRSAVIGRAAVAVTTLAPSGYVEVAGRRYEAFCQSGHADAGTPLRVIELDNFRLVVTQIKESS